MIKVDSAYEGIMTDIRLALTENRITKDEYIKIIDAIHKEVFKGNEDPRPDLIPIGDKIYPELKVKEETHEEN